MNLFVTLIFKQLNTFIKNTFTSFFILFAINLNSQSLEESFKKISLKNNMMGGSLVVFCNNKIIENHAVGKSNFESNLNMQVDSKYRIASISKTITAIAIMQLLDKKLINLDDDISSILGYKIINPFYPDSLINIRMLLSHTSSIIDGSLYDKFLFSTVNDNPIPNLSELVTKGGKYYTLDQFKNKNPGSYFNYSNLNYIILGTIIEKVSHQRFDIYCKKNIIEPLRLDASFNVNDLKNISKLAVIYRKKNNIWSPEVDNYKGIQPSFKNLSKYVIGSNGGRFGPQGGFRCSAEDLAKIFITIMNKGTYSNVRILSETSCDLMLADEWTYNGKNGDNYDGLFRSWGLGIHRVTSKSKNDIVFSDSKLMFGHAGEAYGLVSDAYFDKRENIGVVFLTNGIGSGYKTNKVSKFYTVENEIFKAVSDYININKCSKSKK